MKWRQADVSEVLDFGQGRTIQGMTLPALYDDGDVVFATLFTDGTALRLHHESAEQISEVTWNPAVTWYEIGEPE